MSFLRASRFSDSTAAAKLLVQERRAVRPGHVCEGTLACARCDAPVSVGEAGASLVDMLTCPFCAHQAPVREFLSLRSPTRPARVVVRITC